MWVYAELILHKDFQALHNVRPPGKKHISDWSKQIPGLMSPSNMQETKTKEIECLDALIEGIFPRYAENQEAE